MHSSLPFLQNHPQTLKQPSIDNKSLDVWNIVLQSLLINGPSWKRALNAVLFAVFLWVFLRFRLTACSLCIHKTVIFTLFCLYLEVNACQGTNEAGLQKHMHITPQRLATHVTLRVA